MGKILNPGIRFQLAAGIILMTLAGIGLIGLFSIKVVENNAVYWKIREAHTAVTIIRGAIREKPDFYSSVKALETSLKAWGVTDLVVKDGSGKTVLKSGSLRNEKGKPIPFSADITVKVSGGGIFGPGDSLYLSAPVGTTVTGPLTLEFSVPLAGTNEDLSGVRKFLVFYALLDSFIIIAFSLYFLSRFIIRPISKLNDVARRISGGALEERARVADKNEIGSLASSFNVMAERLGDEIKALERVNRELVSAQEELLRSKTLAAVGGLAAGIAHEIGNPLGAVKGYLEILSRGGLDEDEKREVIKRASSETARIDAIVRDFLEISRPAKKALEPVDVESAVRDAVETVAAGRDLLRGGVEVSMEFQADIPKVMADGGKLRQVFTNLVTNAVQAMEVKAGEKILTIEAWPEERQDPGVLKHRRKDDHPPYGVAGNKEFVCVRFTDTGAGIAPDAGEKIFDPFFTTKEVGRGTGLGLFVSMAIVKAYGGEIGFSSKEGEGSTFTVTLPGA